MELPRPARVGHPLPPRAQRAPAAARDIVYSVYLANTICDIERDRIGFGQVQTMVLKDFGIETEEQLNRIREKLARVFEDQRQKFQ